jgi:organic hydroperoxide reductase OsmC/OhrA
MSTGDDFPSQKYTARCRWSGSTIGGYEAYDRTHSALAPPSTHQLDLSSDVAFRGDPNLLNPEQLVVLAAASCQLLSFLAVAARARINVLDYEDEAIGVMPEGVAPMRITSISLRPTIRVAAGPSADRVRHLVEVAHRECYVANSLRTDIDVIPEVTIDSTTSA